MNFIRMMNDMKMKKKLALTFISAAVLPLVLSSLFLTGKLREIVINDASSQVSDNVERVRKRTEELIKVPLDISYRLTIDNRMKRVAAKNMKVTQRLFRHTGNIRIFATTSNCTRRYRAFAYMSLIRKHSTTGNLSSRTLPLQLKLGTRRP